MDTLTLLEIEIVKMVAQGESNRAIARKMCLAEQTIKNHLSDIYKQLGVKNRAELTHYAWQRGWLSKDQANNLQKK